MEDSLAPPDLDNMFTELIKSKVKEHSLNEYPNECCGLILNQSGKLKVFPCHNSGEDRTKHFVLSPIDYLKATRQGKVIATYHSQESLEPSSLDKINCKGHNLPSLIYSWSTNSFIELWPNHELRDIERKYIGRDFIIGITDCFSLVRDYYKNELNINISNYPRDDRWQEDMPNLIVDNVKNENFIQIDLKDIDKNDIIIFEIKKIPCHLAIYMGNDLILHQLRDKKSIIEFLSKDWKKKIYSVIRYKK